MARIYPFSTKTCLDEFKLRSKALAPLNKKGLMPYANDVYEKILKQPKYGEIAELTFPLVKDAYLYTFSQLEQGFSNTSTTRAPEEAAKNIISKVLPIIRNIRAYGDEYFEKHNMNTQSSDSLYAAAFLSHLSERSDSDDTHKTLIGETGLKILKQQEQIAKDPYNFFKPDTLPESKLIHLVHLKIQLGNMINKIEANDTSPSTLAQMSKYCDHTSALFIDLEKSTLENIIQTRASEIREYATKNNQYYAPSPLQ